MAEAKAETEGSGSIDSPVCSCDVHLVAASRDLHSAPQPAAAIATSATNVATTTRRESERGGDSERERGREREGNQSARQVLLALATRENFHD